ncbi:MAG: 4-hydroxy-tetrahydrodipicolinate reductase [Candidatus Omnitrophota bacterium]
MKKTPLIISGACGKMGRRIARMALRDGSFSIVAAIENIESPFIGKDYGTVLKRTKLGVRVSASPIDQVKMNAVVIEFSTPDVSIRHLKEAARSRKKVVIGTTGFSEKQREEIRRISRSIAVVVSPNMSVCVNLLFKAVGDFAEALSKNYKVRIQEAHHIHKKDAPSGTAKELARVVKEKGGGTKAPIKSIREGEIIGDHTVAFDSIFDTIRITHNAKTRDIFAHGSLVAAAFVRSKKKGYYSMKEVLGL